MSSATRFLPLPICLVKARANDQQWTYDEVKDWNRKMRSALRDRTKHLYQDV